jgi:hypothetical protein
MKSVWTRTKINDTINRVIRLLKIEGIAARRGATVPRADNSRYEISLVEPDGLVVVAMLRFLPDGLLGCRCHGFYFEDANVSKIAAAIAGKGPRDWSENKFRRLESRGGRF